MNMNMELACLDWLQEDADFTGKFAREAIRAGELDKRSTVVAWGTGTFSYVDAICSLSGAHGVLCSQSHQDRRNAEALYPFTDVVTQWEAMDQLAAVRADLILVCGNGQGMVSADLWPMLKRILALDGKILVFGMTDATMRNGFLSRYFPLSPNPMGEAVCEAADKEIRHECLPAEDGDCAIAHERISVSALAQGFAAQETLVLATGDVQMSPRLAKTIRTYAQHRMHRIDPVVFAEGLMLLDADGCGRGFSGPETGLTLTFLTKTSEPLAEYPISA